MTLPDAVALAVEPPLDGRAREVLAELAGSPGGPHRIWRGQPSRSSPWRAGAGDDLVLDGPVDEQAVAWLRFLLREVLAPRSAGARGRATALGLDVVHRVRGTVVADGADGWPVLLRVSAHRVVLSNPLDEVRRRDDPGPAS